MMRKIALGLAALLPGLAIPAAAAETIQITECGVTIPRGQRGRLVADLKCDYRCNSDPSQVCDPYDGQACSTSGGECREQNTVLESGASLQMNGHTIFFAYQGVGIRCVGDQGGSCRITGPGVIIGGKGSAIWGGSLNVYVRDLAIENTDDAIWTSGRLVARTLYLGNREEKLHAQKGVRLRDVVLGSAGVWSGRDLTAYNVDAARGGWIEAEGKIRGRNLSLGYRVHGRQVSLSRSATGAGLYRATKVIADRRIRLHRSSVGTIESPTRPRLIASDCEKSVVTGTTESWNVCGEDP
jgi:hypothetical protein